MLPGRNSIVSKAKNDLAKALTRIMRTLSQIAFFATLWAGSALAAGVRISPILIELTRSQTNAIVSLRNDNDSPVRYQVSAVN